LQHIAWLVSVGLCCRRRGGYKLRYKERNNGSGMQGSHRQLVVFGSQYHRVTVALAMILGQASVYLALVTASSDRLRVGPTAEAVLSFEVDKRQCSLN
jgi:hypothetical protein